MRPSVALIAIAVAMWSLPVHAQQQGPSELPPLPPPPSTSQPSASPPAPSPPSTWPVAPAPPASSSPTTPSEPVDATSSPPIVETVPAPSPAPPPCPCRDHRGAYTHDGFYLRFTSGLGYLRMSGGGPSGDAVMSGMSNSGMLAIGGTPARGLVIAGVIETAGYQSFSFSGNPPDVPRGWAASTSMLGLLADWFPDVHGGWHVGGSLALAVVSVGNDAAQITWSGAGVGAELFGGYDFWVGPEWSLGVQGALTGISSATMTDDNQSDVGYRLGAFGAAIEATLLHH